MSRSLFFVIGATAFSLAYGQAPLFYSNQNQYFLHGLARSGRGLLAHDWLAQTADPTPAFSALVSTLSRLLPDGAFHVVHALLAGVYLDSLVAIARRSSKERMTLTAELLLAAGITITHAAALRFLSQRLLGADYPWYLHAGVASQYVFGVMLQPSAFGVLLVLSVRTMLEGRPMRATLFACLGATLHTTYLLTAGLLVAGYAGVLWRKGERRKAALALCLFAAALAPVVLYVTRTFAPTSAELFSRAQSILVHVRIPHHALPARWFDGVAAMQCAWILGGAIALRRTELGALLLAPLAGAILLTGAQVATSSDALALLFPWRVSAVLMPIVTTMALAKLSVPLGRKLSSRVVAWASALALVGAAGSGILIMLSGSAFPGRDEPTELYRFARTHANRSDLYLLPLRLPEPTRSRRGGLSADYARPREKGAAGLVPPDLQGFRLRAEVPVFVDFKSIPYRDTDVLEWKRRLDTTLSIQSALAEGDFDRALQSLVAERITHVIVRASTPIQHARLARVFADDSYAVYRVEP